MKNTKYSLLLLLGALIWGFAFAFQSRAMALGMEPYTYTVTRMMLAFVCQLPFVLAKRKQTLPGSKRSFGRLVVVSLLLGLMLAIAANLQQIGLMYTTAAKSAFLTALYILLVPIAGLFFGKKTRPSLWLCVGIALVGLYLLSIKEGDLSINKGDLMTLACALAFTVQILLIDKLSGDYHPLTLCCGEFIFATLFSLIPMALTEGFSFKGLLPAWYCIFYGGAISGGVAYCLQILGQRHLPPAHASLIMSFESVFGALGGALLLGERLNVREYIGCGLLFAAIVFAQLFGGEKTEEPFRA